MAVDGGVSAAVRDNCIKHRRALFFRMVPPHLKVTFEIWGPAGLGAMNLMVARYRVISN